MIRFVRGSVYSFGTDYVIIDCNGIGYYINFTHQNMISLGQNVTIFTYQQFREDAQVLYGFLDNRELELFEQLISVKGLGPKTAMNMLGAARYTDIISAIENGQIEFLTRLPSLGAKTSRQIILDLKGKLVEDEKKAGGKNSIALEEAISETSRVLIIGAGLIGLKCAEGICKRAASVTVCDLADRVLSSILDDDAAAIVQRHLEANGLSFLLGDSVARFDKKTAQMNSGAVVDFDVLVLAIGVRANTALAKDAGGEVGRGIRIDSHMRTSLSDIYAAGDCAEGMDISSGETKVLAILPNAVLQGYTAGQNMAGKNETFEKGIPMNSIGFFGLHIMTAGTYEGEIYEERTEDTLKRIYTKDDLLKGFMLIGLEERAGILTSMIREKTPLSSVNFEIMKKVATTAAFPADIRRKKFGGVV